MKLGKVLIVVALVAGGYLLFTRQGSPVSAPPAAVASPSPQGTRGSGPAPGPLPGNAMLPPGARIIEQKVVELNTATQAEIETLPGITPDYARKIIAGRPYQAMSDLARTGIPRAILDEISPPALIRTTLRGLPPPPPRNPK